MRIALVHDYIKEYGGAERVLEELHKLFPDAPIYTAFYQKDSEAYEKFKDAKVIPSWAHFIPGFSTKLHSPLRFLAPLIWGSFDFSKYDVVITSASWYVTKGISKGNPSTSSGRAPREICYCHTPPRWLYGYKTSIEFQKYWPVRVYAMIVGHFMRMYDYNAARRVDTFIANSEEVKARIKKFYRRDAEVIYPPVSLPNIPTKTKKQDFYFVVARIVGGKGLSLAVEAAQKLDIKLKIAGAPAGYYTEYKSLSSKALKNVEFLGHVTDKELVTLYSQAKGFLALSEDEDFGITPVESMLCGTPVIAYFGGGYKETVVEGKTGLFFKEYTLDSLIETIKEFEKMKFNAEDCRKQAQKFSPQEFDRKILEVVKVT
ncbi:MAG: glycosyltransferase [Candidatus Levyibacteriota bacterium]